MEDITDKDIADLKRSLNDLKQKEIDGDARGIEFANGPHDGAKYVICFKDGEPTHEEISLALDCIFHKEEEHEAAYYKWNKKRGRYVFDHLGRRIVCRDNTVIHL